MLDIRTTSVFRNNYSSKKKININRGGTRSGKTYNLVQLFLYWLMYGRIDEDRYFSKGILSIVRKYGSTLKGTVMRDLEELIDDWGVRSKIKINKSERTYTFGKRVIEFIGADDQQKLRGGKRDILYCNEANELNFRQEFFQLLIRTKYKVFIDFNPDDEDVWINTELEQKRRIEEKDVRVIVSTYLDNPYLDINEIKEIERLEKTDPEYWKIYGLGEYGKIQGLIFEDWGEVKEIPKDAEFIAYGMDFGFTNDPTTLVGIYRYNGRLIFDELIYETGLTNQDIIQKLEDLGIDEEAEIWADSSEPKSIEEIFRGGFNIQGVDKGPDSIKFGIDLMKQYEFDITETSVNTRKEFKKYKWAEDKEGKALNKPIDKFNHAIDAIRYACMMKLKKDEGEPEVYFF